mmetsp:Transcript_8114/g.15195  ORF Transcript_8114/g.15195 Transcript_8114/m.15195 type:complete len:245 (+) Transcript_8114:120-854(+)
MENPRAVDAIAISLGGSNRDERQLPVSLSRQCRTLCAVKTAERMFHLGHRRLGLVITRPRKLRCCRYDLVNDAFAFAAKPNVLPLLINLQVIWGLTQCIVTRPWSDRALVNTAIFWDYLILDHGSQQPTLGFLRRYRPTPNKGIFEATRKLGAIPWLSSAEAASAGVTLPETAPCRCSARDPGCNAPCSAPKLDYRIGPTQCISPSRGSAHYAVCPKLPAHYGEAPFGASPGQDTHRLTSTAGP